MIISHTHKFIFIKPTKVAGTSIEVALSKLCGEMDVITPLTKYLPLFGEDEYVHQSQNDAGFYNHMPALAIKNKVGSSVWSIYFKFTVVRNPWDLVVSRFCWEKKFVRYRISKCFRRLLENPIRFELYKRLIRLLIHRFGIRSFGSFLRGFERDWTNERFYFDGEGHAVCDFYIRYENISEDFDTVCTKLSINPGNLPRLKSRTRNHGVHYSNYYNDKTKAIVANLFCREIEYFGYTFSRYTDCE